MRNPWSAKATQRTSSVEPLTLPKRDHSTSTNHEPTVDVGMPAGSSSGGAAAILSPLGQPDAQAFSTPGTLVENETADAGGPGSAGMITSAAPSTVVDTVGNGLVVTVVPNSEVVAQKQPPPNTVILVGAPYEVTTTAVTSSSTPPQSQSPPSPSSLAHGIPPPPQPPRRSQSAVSNRSAAPSITSAYDICRICHCEGSSDAPLISPCCCSGSLKYVHQKCLQQWIKSSQTRSCEVCRFTFIMETKVKPFRKWEKLDISSVERRKILCSVTFHVVAITCVIWSLYVLIDRTAEEIRAGTLDWPFWTKLVVVAIGFTGGLVFMYVQCKMYVQLFRRWQSYNKVIYVQNGPAGGGGGTVGPGGGKYVASSNGDGNGSALNK